MTRSVSTNWGGAIYVPADWNGALWEASQLMDQFSKEKRKKRKCPH
jgi:hypothetical protein